MDRTDVLRRTQEFVALLLNLIVDFLKIRIAGKESGDAEPSGRQPLSLSNLQVLARLLIIGKHGLLHRISSLVDSTSWNLETYRAKIQISFLFKNRKRALFSYSFRKEKLLSNMREDREEPYSSNTISTW